MIRYTGDTTKSTERWSVDTTLTSPIVSIAGEQVVLAELDGGAIRLVVLDGETGAPRGSARLGRDLVAIQLEGLRIYARTKDGGGQIFELDTALKPSTRDVSARAIRERQDPKAMPANGAAKTAKTRIAWEDEALVLHAGKRTTKLVDEDRFRMQLVTMHASGDRTLITLHHPAASGAVAFAFDTRTGAKLWSVPVTGIGPVVHSVYYNKVSAKLDRDMLVVQGVEAGGAYVCTLAIQDGSELACVDNITGMGVFDPPLPTVTAKAIVRKIGPTTKTLRCRKAKAPKSSLVLRRWSAGPITGTITSPSTTCKPKLVGGIVGDKIELVVSERQGTSSCECTIAFTQETNKDSKTVIATHGSAELGRASLP